MSSVWTKKTEISTAVAFEVEMAGLLAVSPSLDGALCKHCVLFAPQVGAGRGHQRLGRLVTVKYDKRKDRML